MSRISRYMKNCIQIHEELLKFFKLDDATAKRYMETNLAKA